MRARFRINQNVPFRKIDNGQSEPCVSLVSMALSRLTLLASSRDLSTVRDLSGASTLLCSTNWYLLFVMAPMRAL
jgi:hypothetical protein